MTVAKNQTRDFAPAGGPTFAPVAPSYAIDDYNAQLDAQAEAGTDHEGVAKIKAAMVARQAQLQPLLVQTQMPLPTADAARAGLTAARGMLRAAIEARHAADDDHRAAVEALGRGQAAVDTARRSLAALGDVDGLIANFKAGCAVAGKSLELPPDLQQRRAESDRLHREIADGERAAVLLSEHVQAAQQRVAVAGGRVDTAVAAVLDHEVELLAIDMVEHQQQAFSLLRRIDALDYLTIGGARYRRPASVDWARGRDPRPWQQIPMPDRDAPRRAWLAVVELLRTDADAPLSAEENRHEET
jgi:hypothetical protein